MSKMQRPVLKLVSAAAEAAPAGRVSHDARGNAIWVGKEMTVDDTGIRKLEIESVSVTDVDGDPYNRSPRGLPSSGRKHDSQKSRGTPATSRK